jgi:hypothetical protein
MQQLNKELQGHTDNRRHSASSDFTTLPVFSLISHSTLKRAGFMRWQLSVCFLNKDKEKHN